MAREPKIQRAIRLYRALVALGLDSDEAGTLIRAERALQRWAERQCGDNNAYASWAVERGADGAPYEVRHLYGHGKEPDRVIRTKIRDLEAAALRRIAAVEAAHPDLIVYHQSDPRGCAVWVVRRADVPAGGDVQCWYTRGIACCL